MRRTITIRWPDPSSVVGVRAVVPVYVNWFDPLTTEQIMQNFLAAEAGLPQPHPDPNMIQVVLER